MLGNGKFSYLENLKKLRAEVPSEYSSTSDLKYKYFHRQDHFKSIDELNTYLNKLSDEDFELFIIQMTKILKEERENT